MTKEIIGTAIPQEETLSLARLRLPKIRQFFDSEEGQKAFAARKATQALDDTKECEFSRV